jgi:hypothetical protein
MRLDASPASEHCQGVSHQAAKNRIEELFLRPFVLSVSFVVKQPVVLLQVPTHRALSMPRDV